MDGQRRLDQQMMKFLHHMLRRLTRPQNVAKLMALGNRRGVRGVARAGGLAFMGGALVLGLLDGGYMDSRNNDYRKIAGKAAGMIGYAADDIRISGLERMDAEAVLKTIGVQPGASLIGFDAVQARKLLENVDWVVSAKVMRMFPNQLEITLEERQPFAIWQREGRYYVIDKSGAAISSLPPNQFTDLILVTGEGAQTSVADLVAQLDNHPTLRPRVKAAARAGQRRWNIVLDNGVVVALPEHDVDAALTEVERLDREHGLLAMGITRVDLRIPGDTAITVAEVNESSDGKSQSFKVSGRQ